MRILMFCLLCSIAVVSWAKVAQPVGVQSFIQSMVKDHGFDQRKLESLLSSLKPNKTILNMMAPKPSAKPAKPLAWYEYRDRFVTPSMIRRGKAFWQQNKQAVELAAKQYQVNPAIIVATLGVETRYGRIMGNFSVLQALYTLGFYVPRRARFFQSELEQLLLLARKYHIDPGCIKGSYAGAIGPGQFMPSSLVNYAENDRLHSCKQPVPMAQAIRDIARYYHRNGWRQGEAVAVRANVAPHPKLSNLPDQYFRSRMTVHQLKEYGITPRQPLSANTKASFFNLLGKQSVQSWLTLHNFYVITRYNKSLFYAMTVYQLTKALR